MTDDNGRWKDKYLASLEEHERLETRWQARVDLLRRGLVRSSLAVEGADRAVDQCMNEMRELLRDGDLDQGLERLIPRLERAVLDSERNRQDRVVQLAAALGRLVEQLQAQPVPADVRKGLKRFARSLDERVAQAREVPALLVELADLQHKALAEQAGTPGRGGLLERLFGRQGPAEAAAPADASALPERPIELAHPSHADDSPGDQTVVPLAPAPSENPVPTPDSEASVVPPPTLSEAPPEAPAAPAAAPSGEAQTEPVDVSTEPEAADPFALPASPEPGYSAIAERVEATLRSLLEDLPLPEHHRPRAEALRQRIAHGLNWYELVPVLDDLAMLILAVADLGQREFERYLQQLNERLCAMQDHLAVAREGHAQNQAAAEALDAELREQVDGLQTSVMEASDLQALKRTVEGRLEGLLRTVDAYRQQRSDTEQALGERLGALSERVVVMEQAASDLRSHLEEQRQKALADTLTGLPNRAAWDERLMLEVARWQRYGHQLALAVIDIDHFKRINDGFGHLAGDRVLKIVANELRKRVRKTDFLARFGGEEFVMLLTDTELTGAMQLLETLRKGIENCPFHFKGQRVQVTFSAGVTVFRDGDVPDQVFGRADKALYRAKGAGRNRIESGG